MHGDPREDPREHRHPSVSISGAERVPAVTPEGVPFAILTWPRRHSRSFCLSCWAWDAGPSARHTRGVCVAHLSLGLSFPSGLRDLGDP